MIEEINVESVRSELEELFKENHLDKIKESILLTRCLSENWFSDTLAWLLSPNGTHGLSSKFAEEFLKRILINKQKQQENRAVNNNSLKTIESIEKFDLTNASAVREFYLSNNSNKKTQRTNKFCDIVFFDLDPDDGLFILIENKLFSRNQFEQLEQYCEMANNKYRSSVMEYVYLTIDGSKPIDYSKKKMKGQQLPKSDIENDSSKYDNWVRMSWTTDIRSILEKFIGESDNSILKDLDELLCWLNNVRRIVEENNILYKMRGALLKATSDCLIQELNRLKTDTGEWSIKINKKSVTISHSRTYKKILYIEILLNLNVTIQSKKNDTPLYEKIIVPFGTNADQVYNMIDISCIDIYEYSFGNTEKFRNSKGRIKNWSKVEYKDQDNMKKKYHEFFNFVSINHNILKVMYTMSNYATDAFVNDQYGNNIEEEE
jgi:hypothetical protein